MKAIITTMVLSSIIYSQNVLANNLKIEDKVIHYLPEVHEVDFDSKIEPVIKEIKNNELNILNNKHLIEINKEEIDSNNKKSSERISKNIITIEENRKNIKENNKKIESNTALTKNNEIKINSIKDEYIDNLQANNKTQSLQDHLEEHFKIQSINQKNIHQLNDDIHHLDKNLAHFKSDTQNRFYNVEKRANQGIASVAAMSNLPFTDNATFSTAIGVGNYRNATAFAWGMQYRINENIKVKASTAWNESNNFVSAGGIGINW